MTTPDVAALAAALASNPALKDALLSALGVPAALPAPPGAPVVAKPDLNPPTHRSHSVRCRGCGAFNWIPLDADPEQSTDDLYKSLKEKESTLAAKESEIDALAKEIIARDDEIQSLKNQLPAA